MLYIERVVYIGKKPSSQHLSSTTTTATTTIKKNFKKIRQYLPKLGVVASQLFGLFIVLKSMATKNNLQLKNTFNLLDGGNDTELFSNASQLRKFSYARLYQTDNNQHMENRQLVINNDTGNNQKSNTIPSASTINITIIGIPDGVSPYADRALIPAGTKRRLYVFSDEELDANHLEMIDSLYGKQPYPNFKCDLLTQANTLDTFPKNNFYMRNETMNEALGNQSTTTCCPTMSCSYIEYRYLQRRHILANICFNPYNGAVYRLVIAKRPMLCIIMPENFIRTGLKTGYFRFENNLIVRVYSRYLLSAHLAEPTTNPTELDVQQQPLVEVSVFDFNNVKMNKMVRRIFGRFGLHKIDSFNSNHIFAYDKYVTMIVGSIANISLPLDYATDAKQ